MIAIEPGVIFLGMLLPILASSSKLLSRAITEHSPVFGANSLLSSNSELTFLPEDSQLTK